MSRRFPVTTVLLILLAGPAYGQVAHRPADDAPAAPRAPLLGVPPAVRTIARLPAGWTLGPAPAAHAASAMAPARRASAFSARSILHTLVGAAVGAGVGFFASQVIDSDWEPEGRVASHRLPWTVGGAVLGGVGGHLLGIQPPIEDNVGPRTRMTRGYEVLTRQDLAQSSAQNAYQAIRALRPRWLRGRGASSKSEMILGVIVAVYFGNSRLGTQEQLREISIRTIEEIRYYDAAQASARWGTGHPNGAIQLLTPTNH